MYHSAANPIIRVAVFPVLLLFWQYVYGTDLPLLAPAMCAVFLTTTHEPPPVIMVFVMGGILFITAWFQALMSELLIDYVHVYYLFLFGIFLLVHGAYQEKSARCICYIADCLNRNDCRFYATERD